MLIFGIYLGGKVACMGGNKTLGGNGGIFVELFTVVYLLQC